MTELDRDRIFKKKAEESIIADGIRERLIKETSLQEKIDIMFAYFIKHYRLDPKDVIKIGDEYLK